MKIIKVNRFEPVKINGEGCPFCFHDSAMDFCEHPELLKKINNNRDKYTKMFMYNDKFSGYHEEQVIDKDNKNPFPDWCLLEDCDSDIDDFVPMEPLKRIKRTFKIKEIRKAEPKIFDE